MRAPLTVHSQAVSDGYNECPFLPGDFVSYGTTLVEDMLGLGGVSDQIKCDKVAHDSVSRLVLELYLIVGGTRTRKTAPLRPDRTALEYSAAL